ncbi:MAG TPA: DUF58 domain-containing protein [Anaerolineaceae bacterium]|nr:DUF58 domain-containing protein [Anaerolineaceae bacterium]HPN50308.1 DUF58 domain-containing protein [Anaerolineaceae bacterium]
MKIGRSFWVVLALLAASFLASTIPSISSTSLYYRLFYLWLGLIVVGWVWTVISIRGMSVRRYQRTLRQQVGQIFEERFEIINNAWFSKLWIEVNDKSSLPGTGGSRVMTWIGRRQSRSYLAYTELSQRGLYNLGPTTITTGDIFGLFRSSVQIKNEQQTLLVLPYMVDLDEFPSPHGLLPGGKAQRRRTLEVTPYAAGVREYSTGDPLNRIHWPSTARREKLMVKEFELDPRAEVWIVMDAYQGVQFSQETEKPRGKADAFWWMKRAPKLTIPPATFEYAVCAAASVANYYVKLGREVGLISMGQSVTLLPPEKGERQLGKLLETLALVKDDGELPLLGLVAAHLDQMTRGSTVIMITPCIHQEVVQAVDEITLRGMKPVVILVDPGTFGGPQGADEIQATLHFHGIPCFVAKNHEDLRQALEGKRISQSRPWWQNDQEPGKETA